MFEELRPHLAELRKRLGLSVLSVLVMFIVAFSFHEAILAWITAPLDNALQEVKQNITHKSMTQWHVDVNGTQQDTNQSTLNLSAQAAMNLSRALREAAQSADTAMHDALTKASDAAGELAAALKANDVFNPQVTTHQVAGTFFVALKVSFFAAIIFALPFILYQIWLFIAPGLYSHEKKMILPFVIGGTVMFLVGVLFAYYVVTPFGFQFLITFGSFLYTPLINIEDYVGFFTKIMVGFGIAFELPVFAYFLGMMGLITDRTLKDFFKYAIVLIFILAAILTPPDVLTQMLMAFPLIALYGVSILIVKMVNPETPEDEEDASNQPAEAK